MVTDADSWGLGVGVSGLVAAMAATGVAGGGCRDGGWRWVFHQRQLGSNPSLPDPEDNTLRPLQNIHPVNTGGTHQARHQARLMRQFHLPG